MRFPTLRGRRSSETQSERPLRELHLEATDWPEVVYAIGDVHGCHDEMLSLLDLIRADCIAFDGEKWLVFLGDYIDRGPDSAAVLDRLTVGLPGFRTIALFGNHERMLLDFIANPGRNRDWLGLGGLETLQSYGIDTAGISSRSPGEIRTLLAGHMPHEHLALLGRLKLTLSLPGTVFVHATLQPGVPIAQQDEATLLWGRSHPGEGTTAPVPRIVHGHTPVREPYLSAERICVDTGAYATGILTAARLTPDGGCSFLQTSSRSTTG